MANYFYEPLSAQDSTFLPQETANHHMHITWTCVFEAGTLANPHGGIDVDRIRQYIESRLYWIPRYRQRLAFVPVENRPVWVDDDRFNINYHVRHASLPQPGDDAQLKQLTARIASQQLDRRRPLWEMLIVEGLSGGRFAIISKTHHCMVDGVATVDIMTLLLSRVPRTVIEEAPDWLPRPAPTPRELLADTLFQHARAPFDVVSGVAHLVQSLRQTSEEMDLGLTAAWKNVRGGLAKAPDTPLNRPIGPHRRVEWTAFDLAEAKEIKNGLHGTINDVVLATVAGALRRFLTRRHFNFRKLDFRVVVPVSVRSEAEHAALGNRASAWLTRLPVDEADPEKRFARVRQETGNLKQTQQALGAQFMLQVAEWAGPNLMSVGVGVLSRLRPYNLIITNIPGPQEPYYLLTAQMLECYPQVPLFRDQGLGIALSSYLGQVNFGFSADWDVMPDLDEFVDGMRASFKELLAAARKLRRAQGGDKPASPGRPRRRAPARVPAR